MLKIFIGTEARHTLPYTDELTRRMESKGLEAKIARAPTPDIDVIIYEPSGPIQDFSPFPNLKLVQSIWAGVDRIVGNETLKAPLCRMVDSGLREGMREYVSGWILADHIRCFDYAARQIWDDSEWLPLARSQSVSIIGLGTLGQSVGIALQSLGFRVIGWSRNQKQLDGMECVTGDDGLRYALSEGDYIVTLLPHTRETENIIAAETLSLMKPSAMLINPGRGALINEDDLLAALDEGCLRHAVLDVFKTEPLPDHHPFWAHERVTVTPHIAAKSRLETACDVVMENLDNLINNRPLAYLVDRKQGY